MKPFACAGRQRGVSLIEALVAMTIMAFGMLGVVGLQGTLRTNSDLTKQRAEAVRIAQAAMEDWRGFESLSTIAASDFADIASTGDTAVNGYAISNTTFTRNALVAPATPGADDPKLKSVVMRVSWPDRAGQTMSINLVSSIAGIAPELAGSLGLPGDRGPTAAPLGRNAAIPPGSLNQGDGTSQFTPITGGSVTWVFNNTTGIITRVCNPFPTCTDTTLFPLSGYVRFATGTAPTAARAEIPDSPRPSTALVTVTTTLTEPGTSTVSCFTRDASDSVAYFCALPVTTSAPVRWSGRSRLTITNAALTSLLSGTLADNTASNFKVCRYTRDLSDTPAGGNASHPLDYASVTGPLNNQNFLVISAGNGTTPFGCPIDDASTPDVNGNTYRHQPLS